MAGAFRAQVGGRFAALAVMNDDVDTLANNIKEVLTESAEEILGRSRKKLQPWVTNEVLDLCDNGLKMLKFFLNVLGDCGLK